MTETGVWGGGKGDGNRGGGPATLRILINFLAKGLAVAQGCRRGGGREKKEHVYLLIVEHAALTP